MYHRFWVSRNNKKIADISIDDKTWFELYYGENRKQFLSLVDQLHSMGIISRRDPHSLRFKYLPDSHASTTTYGFGVASRKTNRTEYVIVPKSTDWIVKYARKYIL